MSEQKDFIIKEGVLEKYTGPGGEIEIPAGVTAIGKDAFAGNENLTAVTIPEGVTRMEGEHIGSCITGAFMNCPKLTRVDLPKSLEHIGTGVFYNCPALTDIALPEGLKTIGEFAFRNCATLTAMTFPSTLREIGDGAFEDCALTSVVLPEGLTKMGINVFQDCAALQSAVLPSTLEEIPGGAFRNCGKLRSVVIPEGVKEIGHYAFSGCVSFQPPALPDSVEKIGLSSFFNCAAVPSFRLPRGLQHYEPTAFMNASILYGANRGTHPQTFTIDSDHPCFRIVDNMLLRTEEGLLICSLTGAQEQVEIPEGVTEIGASAFVHCQSLKTVKLPESLRKIGKAAFEECENLKTVVFPEQLREIGESAFMNCQSLKTVKLPKDLRKIGSTAFANCTRLSGADLPPLVREIGSMAFINTALTSVVIPEGVARIGNSTWEYCSKLKTVVIPDSVKNFGDKAFALAHQADVQVRLSPDQSDGKAAGNYAFVGGGKYMEGVRAKTLAFPNLPLWTAATPEMKLKMVMGFCAAPEKFSDAIAADYARYARSQRRRILAAAEKENIPGVREYYDALDGPDKKGGKKKTDAKTKAPNYKKLSALNKVLLLEETVLSGDMEKLEEVLTGCGEFEYTARALGMAGRYGTPEMVQRLLKAGANFNDGWEASLKTKYDTYTVYRGFDGTYTNHHYFERMLMEKSIQDTYTFGDFRNIDNVLFPGGKEREPQPKSVRMENLRLICKNKKNVCEKSYLLRLAILDGDADWINLLRECGVKLRDHAAGFSEARSCGERDAFLNALNGSSEQKMRTMIGTLIDILAEEKKTIAVNVSLLRLTLQSSAVTNLLLEKGDCKSLKAPELLREVVSNGTAETLAYCIEKGMIKSKVTRDNLIQQSINLKKTEHTAVLLDYKNKTADFAKERAAEEARMMRELTAAPDSVTMMKKIWSYQKQKDGALVITGYKGSETEITVPARIGKADVTAIGGNAFSPDTARLPEDQKKARNAITSVTIPEGVTELADCAFFRCKGLEKVVLPESLKTIGKSVFAGCERLETVTLPAKLRSIGDGAFSGCTRFEKIVIPDSVKSMGTGVFSQCARLREVTLPKGLKELDGTFIDCISLETVPLPKGLTKLDRTFMDCTGLREVILPEGLTEIGAYTFEGCANLEALALPERLTVIGEEAFAKSGLTAVTVPDAVTEIGWGAFMSCERLAQVRLPAGIEILSREIFDGCKALRHIDIPAGVRKIEGRAFCNCEGLEALTVPGTVEVLDGTAFMGCGHLRTVTLEEGVRELGNNAFGCCPELEPVVLPRSLESLDPYTFDKTPVLPEDHPHLYIQDGMLCTRKGTLILCDTAKQGACRVPEGITEIGPYAFNGCKELTEIVLPESVKHIQNQAFENCAKLEAVNLPPQLETLGGSAFEGCAALSGELVIPEKITSLESRLFSGCESLSRVVLHAGVDTFYSSTFWNCKNLIVAVPAGSKMIKGLPKYSVPFEILKTEESQ